MSGNPLLDAWDRDQRRRTGGGTQGNPLLDAWDRENGTAPPPKADGIVDTVIEKVGDVGSFLAESMGLNFASRNWREERGRTGRAQLDASVNEGVLDKAGSLLERGAASADAGVDTTFGTMLGSKRLLNSAATQRAIGNMPVEGNTSWEDLKANPGIGSLGNFVLDTTTESVPLMMAAAAPWVGIPAVAASGTGNIAQNRADANGGGPVSGKDLAIAAPFGIGSAVLERTGLMGILEAPGKNAATRIARAAGKEGLTESAQSALEYTGGAAGTNQGFNLVEMFDQAAGGALGGAGMGGSIRGGIELGAKGGRAAQSVVTGRPIPKGVREASGEAGVPLSPEDEASPLPTRLIAQGRGVLADADAMTGANRILGSAGLPSVGERVSIRYPDGRVESGTMADAFADAEFDGEPGVKINLDGGGTLDEHVSTLADAGVSLSRLSREELGAAADAIDAGLAAQVQDTPGAIMDGPTVITELGGVRVNPAPAPARGGFKVADQGKIAPVDNAKAIAEELFPGSHVTSWTRPAGAAGKAGKKSWHVKSKAAIDMRPVKGMTFDQAIERFRSKGYSIIEAIDETDPATMKKTGATGPHWHFVLGTGGTPVQGGTSAGGRVANGGPSVDPFADDGAPREGFQSAAVEAVQLPEPGGDLRGEPIDKEWVRFAPESGTLGVPRAAMPQIAAENRGAMVNFLNARGVSHKEDTVPAADLKPTQAEFSTDKVMKARDFSGGDRAILVSSDGHVIDGHHQWLAKRDAGEDVRVIRLGATAKELLDIVPEFPSATVDEGSVNPRKSGADQKPVQSVETVENPPPDAADQTAGPEWSISDTSGGKSVAITGATGRQIAAVTQAVPQAKRLMRADGASVYPKRHEEAIRAALEAFDAKEAAGGPSTGLAAWGEAADREDAAEAAARAAQEKEVGNPPAPAASETAEPPQEGNDQPERAAEEADSAPAEEGAAPSVEDIADEFDGAADPDAPMPVSAATMDRMRADPELRQAVRAELRKRREQRDAEKADKPTSDEPTAVAATPEEATPEEEAAPAEQSGEPLYDEDGNEIGTYDPATGRVDIRKRAPAQGNLDLPEPVQRESRIGEREPVATLTGDELGVDYRGPEDMPALRAAAVEHYKREMLGKTVIMADGAPVSFSGRGLRHSTSLKGDILLRLVPAIPDILRKGEITWSGPGDRLNINKRIEVAARVTLGDRAYKLFVIVREHSDSRRRQYDLTFDNGYRDTGEGAEGRSSLIDGDVSRRNSDPEKKSPSASLNLRLVESESNAAVNQTGEGAQIDTARADLQQRLTDYGIADRVALAVGNAILPERVAGEFRAEPGIGRFITIALDTSPDAQFTLDHEVIHAASNMGLFLPPEWRSLEAAARADRAMMGSIRKRYPNLSEEEQVEEAIADRFARWQRGDRERGFVARAFERLRDVLRAIGEALRGNGFTTAESVMRALAGGEIGAREGGTPMAAVEPTDPMAGDDMGTVQKRSMVERADTARTALARLAGSGSPFSGKMADAFDRWRTAVQDRYLPLLRTQQRVEQQLGRPLAESENPYLGEELLTGRVGAKLENLAENMVEPLFDQMHRDDVSIEELESYLYARHAPERNKRIAEINPEFKNGGGSGMSDIEAAAIINRIEKAGKTAALQRAAAMVDAIRDYALQERIDGGLMSPDEAKAWRETYQNYVPLRGKGDADTEGEADGIRINRSSGINVKGKESRRAFGRRSQADNILAYSLLQAEEAIVRAETNRVAQRFVELARAAPDGKFWAVDKVTRNPVMNETTGIVRYEDQTRIQPEDAPFTVSAKFNGEEHRVTMNRDNASARRLADSMRNLTQQQLDWVTQHLGKVNRFLSAVNTSWNPEFVITNAFRDLQAASINMAGIDVDGLVRRTLKDYPAALAGSMRGAFRVDKGEWGKWYREFTAEGGRVYFNNVEDLAGLKGRIEKEFSRAAARKQGVKMDMLTAKRGFAAVRDFVEAANSGVENAVRLAAYKNAREAGATKAQAASIAKNLTVNFNRRGQMGPAINAAYLFFNASMQGTARILTAMKSPRVRKILAGVVVGGFLIELLNAFLSGTDDDGEAYYDKISDFDKSRNIIIMIPGTEGEHIKIPMPYGYNVFANAGRSLAEVWRRGGDRWQETAGNFVSSVADAFNPIGGTDSILKAIAPTIIDPIVDLEQNSDYSGRPIMPEQNPFESPEPDAQRYFGSVGPHWKAVTDWLTAATGGNDVEPGAIDISPETLEHLSGVVFGAAGSFIDRNVGLASKLATGEEVEANDFPLVRKVYGEKPGWYDKSAFYDRVGQVEQALAYAKGYIEREDWDRFDTFVGKNEQLLGLEPVTKAANKEMRAIRKARRENDFAREMGQIDDDTWRAGNDAVKEAEKRVIGAYNSAWNGAMLPQRDNGDASR